MNAKDYRIFVFECDYINSDYKEEHVHAITMAPSLHEAVEAIEYRLPYCFNLSITEGSDEQFVWLNKTLYDRYRDPKNEYGLDCDDTYEIIERCGEHTNPEDTYRDDFTRAIAAEFGEDVNW